MTEIERLQRAAETSRQMFPQRPRKSTMNMLELTDDDERILDKVWAKLAKERGIERHDATPVKEAA